MSSRPCLGGEQLNSWIKNGTIVIFSDNRFILENKDLFIVDGKITFTPPFNNQTDFEIYDASNMLIIPGLINMHTHAYMSLFRNYADDIPFNEWLFKKIMPIEDQIKQEDAFWTSMFSCIEMIETGTTCFLDMHMFKNQTCKAVAESGLRAFIGRGLVGNDLQTDGLERFKEFLEEQENYTNELIQCVISPHAIYSCAKKLLIQLSDYASQKGILKQIHLSESIKEVEDSYNTHGMSPVQLLEQVGFLDQKSILAHCVHLSDLDLQILARSNASIVTNPASNAKLGNGIAPLTKYMSAGVNVCIGTDGVASNNTLNMFREMNLLSIMHKGITGNCTVLKAEQTLKMATLNAAKALSLSDSIGTISEGAYADLAFLDLNSCSLLPRNNLISALCYSANGSEVISLMVNGNFVMKNYELLTIDKERVYFEVNKISNRYL